MIQFCKECNKESEFSLRTKRGKLVPQSKCRECNKRYQKKHYKSNKHSYITKNNIYRNKNYSLLLDYLRTRACKDCGNSDLRVLEFDHLYNKKVGISKLIRNASWETVLLEISKCEIVCANCHRIRTLTRSNSRKVHANEEPRI